MRSSFATGFRALRTDARTTFLAIAILGLGMAAATVTFSVVDHVAIRPLPFPADDRLVAIGRVTKLGPEPREVAPQDYFLWQQQATSLSGLAAVSPSSLRLMSDSGPVNLVAYRATANLFEVLQVRPEQGQTFGPEHERAGQDAVAVISHVLWTTRFASDPTVIGRSVVFERETRTILGVMPAGFTYPIGRLEPTDVWVPFVARANERDPAFSGRGYSLAIVGRLAAWASLAEADHQIQLLTAAAATTYPASGWSEARVAVMSLWAYVAGPARPSMLLALAAVLIVVLLACANVANLLLARGVSRSRELAVRAALGASPAQLLREKLAEALLLSGAASAAGLLAAAWGVGFATTLLPAGIARAQDIDLDARVLFAAVGATIMTTLLVGVIPAVQATRLNLIAVLKSGSSTALAGAAVTRWRSAVLVAEIALVVTVLFTTTLFVTSFLRVTSVDLGFDFNGLVSFSVIAPPVASLPESQRAPARASFWNELVSRVAQTPGVAGVTLNDRPPLLGSSRQYGLRGDDSNASQAAEMMEIHAVSANYLDVMKLRLVRGRFFNDRDVLGSPPVAVVSDMAATRLFPEGEAIGRSFKWQGTPTVVVGIVHGVKLGGPEVDVRPEVYLPFEQSDDTEAARVIARTNSEPTAVIAGVTDAIRSVLPVGRRVQPPQELEKMFRMITAHRRFNAGLMTVFGLLALLIGAIGIYGVMAFGVAQQTREIGVRMALGASRGQVMRSILAQASRHLAVGLSIGLLLAVAVSRLLESVLFGVTSKEPMLYVAVGGIVVAIGFIAAMLPAARASRINPLSALRSE